MPAGELVAVPALQADLLKAVLESSGDPVFTVDRDHRYTSFNSAHAAAMKALYGGDIALGHDLLGYQTVREDRETARANLDRALSGERVAAVAFSGEDARSRRYFEVTHEPVRDAAGAVSGVLVTARDLTGRQRDREAVTLREHALESSLNAIAIADPDGTLTYVNGAFLEMWGYGRGDEVIGRAAVDFWESSGDAGEVRAALLETGSWRGELVARRRDGTSFVAELTTSAVLDDDGAPLGALAAFIDVTDSRRAEAALRDAGDMLSLAQRSAGAGIWDWDMETGALTWSPEFLELFGLPPGAEASFDTWRAVLHPADREAAEARIQHAIDRHEALHNEYRIVRPGGQVAWIEALGDVLYDAEGAPRRMTGICIDISDRKRAAAALRESEEKWRRVLVNTPQMVVSLDPEGRVVFANDCFLRLTGWTLAEVLGRDWFASFLPEPTRDEVRRVIFTMMSERRTGGYSTHENDILTRDGQVRSVSWSNVLTADADGSVLGVTGLGVDITERKRAEAALRASETHFRAFFEKASVGMATTSPKKGWIEVNDALCAMLAYSREELAGLTWAELTHPYDLAADVARFEAVVAGETDGYSLDKRFLRKDGGVVHTPLVVHAVREPDGELSYFAVVLEDVSDRVRAEEALRRLNAELEQRVEQRTTQLSLANRELESFAYSISHDLRAPLRALDGFSEILVEDYRDILDTEGRRHLERVRSAAQRMGQLIDALLALSRLSRRDLVVETVDLSALAEGIIERLRAADSARTVVVSVMPGCRAVTDAGLAEVLLGDLLENAWKFTGDRAVAHIEFGWAEVDGECAFYVRDDGAGFDMAYVDKLFQPFQRLHAAEEYPGTGIGLASVRRIATRLGGRCWPEATVGGGATFCFTLGTPLERPPGPV